MADFFEERHLVSSVAAGWLLSCSLQQLTQLAAFLLQTNHIEPPKGPHIILAILPTLQYSCLQAINSTFDARLKANKSRYRFTGRQCRTKLWTIFQVKVEPYSVKQTAKLHDTSREAVHRYRLKCEDTLFISLHCRKLFSQSFSASSFSWTKDSDFQPLSQSLRSQESLHNSDCIQASNIEQLFASKRSKRGLI